MKQLIAVILAVLMLVLTACSTPEDTSPEMTFRGVIVERVNDSVTVEVAEDEEERNSSDLIRFSVSGLTPLDAAVGDTVSITYTGVIMESYPAQVVATGWKILKRAEKQQEIPEEEPKKEPEALQTPEPEVPTLGDEPQVLVITASDTEYRISSGNYQWSMPGTNPDGTETAVIACGMHPLDYTGEADMISYAEGESLFFRFDVPPRTVTCRCWTEQYWGDPQYYEGNFEVVELGENTLTPLSNLRYVYELNADWGDGCSATYIFGTICDAVPSAE